MCIYIYIYIYIYKEVIWFGLVWFYDTSTIVGNLDIYGLVWFFGISAIVGFLMSNPV